MTKNAMIGLFILLGFAVMSSLVVAQWPNAIRRLGVLAELAATFARFAPSLIALGIAAFASFAMRTRLGQTIGKVIWAVIGLALLNMLAGIPMSLGQGGWALYPPLSFDASTTFFSPEPPDSTGLLVDMLLRQILQTLAIAGCCLVIVVGLAKDHPFPYAVAILCAAIGACTILAVIILARGHFVTQQWPIAVIIAGMIAIGWTNPLRRTDFAMKYALFGAIFLAVQILITLFAQYQAAQNVPPKLATDEVALADTYFISASAALWPTIPPLFLLLAGFWAWLRPNLSQRFGQCHAALLLGATLLGSSPLGAFFFHVAPSDQLNSIFIAMVTIQSIAGVATGVLCIVGLIAVILKRAR